MSLEAGQVTASRSGPTHDNAYKARRVGIVGGLGALAGADVLYKLVDESRRCSDGQHCEILFEQYPFDDRSACAPGSRALTSRKLYVYRVMRELARRDVDTIVLPCFVSHCFIEELEPELQVPVTNLMSALGRHIWHGSIETCRSPSCTAALTPARGESQPLNVDRSPDMSDAARANNLLILMSDEHTRKVLGCYGNPIVQTPNLDRLAARGTLFTDAYTPSPICVPARASFATGHYGHATGHWDNATPYTGDPESWGHKLQQRGIRVGSIGKLHYRNAEDPTGFDFQELPMHLVNGVGDVLGCVREPLPKRWKSRSLAENIGPGESSYTRYDRQITDTAVAWLEARAADADSAPWVVFVSLVAPHFPLIAPEAFYALYAESGLAPTKPVADPEHPWMAALRNCMIYDNFDDEKTRVALASYYGLVSFLDASIGRVLDTLDVTGLTSNTQVLYVSDHGDNIGERALWGKSNLLEEAAGIPTIIAGPGVPCGRRCRTPVNLTDVYPTVMAAMGIEDTNPRPGESLLALADAADAPDRVVFSEYHACGAVEGAFMVRLGHWKYIHFVSMPPQLFNLDDDPDELVDLGSNPRYAGVRAEMETELRKICDPEAVDRQARADQRAIIDRHGGIEAVLARGGFGATPAPGEAPDFVAAS